MKSQILYHKHIQIEQLNQKKIQKITNKLIRNEDMTKQEALKAKKKLKDNSLPPALSTRSNDRVLRSSKQYI